MKIIEFITLFFEMYFPHVIKTLEFYAETGGINLPPITPETIIPIIEALLYNFARIGSLYLAYLFL